MLEIEDNNGLTLSVLKATKYIINLPAMVGDYVFAVRNTKFTGGNKYWVEKGIVKKIGCDKKGWYININGTRSNLNSFGVGWFTSEAEAQAKLTELLNK